MTESKTPAPSKRTPSPAFMFASRWLQLPLYLGLILAQCVYVFHFLGRAEGPDRAAMGNDERCSTSSRP
jgi:hypothetical protein